MEKVADGTKKPEESKKKEEQKTEDKPFYLPVIVVLLKVTFFVYDVLVYLPFKIFADPAEKLNLSTRVKAQPEKEDDVKSPWRHVKTLEGHLAETAFPGCETLAAQWNAGVAKFTDSPCFGTREVLKVHKQAQKDGRVFEKVGVSCDIFSQERWSDIVRAMGLKNATTTALELGEYIWRKYTDVDRRVNLVGSALRSLGLKAGNHIVIFAETREEWMTTALACFKCNFPIVTVYATLGDEAVQYAINEVEGTTIVTSASLVPKVAKAIKNGAALKNVIVFDSIDPDEKVMKIENVTQLSFDELLNKGSTDDIKPVCKKEDVALIMYTSGTTGNPKGVMLSHENIVAATKGQGDVIPLTQGDRYIGYLPLAHILEVCGELVSLSKGVQVGYSSPATLFDRAPKVQKGSKGDCSALRPTLIACVPAIMDRIYKEVNDKVNSSGPLFKELFNQCYERKKARYQDGYSSFILNKLVFNKIGEILGGDVRCVLSGGAPLNAETQRFMNICFCCPVVQGYGLTETCGGGTLADAYDLSTGTVGPPLTCCSILLEDWKEGGYKVTTDKPEGEILIGGRNVALGYFKGQHNNNADLEKDFVTRNGRRYFVTGDIGRFRSDGSLFIIDRKKDLLKLSHGEYISLGKVETSIQTHSLVDNVCIYGDSDKSFVIALIVPNERSLKALANEIGAETGSWEKICKDKNVAEEVLKRITASVKGKLERAEIPQKVYLVPEPWTAASGHLTEALKLKRKVIEKDLKEEINKLYK